MAKWYDIRIIKPMEIIEVNVGQTFNIFEITEFKKWKAPYMIYSYKYLKANSGFWDSKLNLKDLGGGRFRYDSETGDITNESIVSVLIMESNDIQILDKNIKYSLFKDKKQVFNWNTYHVLNTKQIKYRVVDSIKDMYWSDSEQGFILPNIDLSNKKCFYLVTDMVYTYGVSNIKWEINPHGNQGSIIKVMQNISSPTSKIRVSEREPNNPIPSNTTMAVVYGIMYKYRGDTSLSVTIDGNPIKGDILTEKVDRTRLYSILNIQIKPNFKVFETHIQNNPDKSSILLTFYSPTGNFKSTMDAKFKIMYIY